SRVLRRAQTNNRATSTNRHPEEVARACAQLSRTACPRESGEWKRAPSLWPPFETAARFRERPLRVTVVFAALLASSGRASAHLRQHLAAEDLDAGEDRVLRHAGPAHAHGKVGDAGAMLRHEFVRHLRGRADREAAGGEAAQLVLRRAAALFGYTGQSPR